MPSTIREQIRARFSRSGRTLTWLSKASGVPIGTVHAYLNDKSDTRTENADKLLAALRGQRALAKG